MPYTLVAASEFREEIRKSRFHGRAAPISSSDEALAFIQSASDSSASHNCWAWKFGQHYRFSDDGEPGGTAGRPILAAIEAQHCDQVVVVVTRWYGGIQLGTGGLARAYGGCANKCLQAGERSELVQRIEVQCHLQFAELPLLKAQLSTYDSLLLAEHYDAAGAELQLAIPPVHLATLQRLIADLTRGRVQLNSH
jgi:uncharacterized YigZ family protein